MKTKTKAPTPGQGQGDAFFAVAGVMPDGTLREIGGTGPEPRTWASVEAYHEARGWRAGTVVLYYPPDFSRQKAEGDG